MKTKINKEVWKSSSVNYLNTLASDVNELKKKSTKLSTLIVGNDLNIISHDGMLQAETDYQNAFKHFWKEYVRISDEWNEINKKEVE